MQINVDTVNTGQGDANRVDTVNTGQTVQTIAITEHLSDEILLAVYRASNGSILSRKGRETEQATVAIAYHKERQESVLAILKKRGKRIEMVNRAFTIVEINNA